ncbi:MAG: hypothetical protein JWO63_1217 [Frankiales bacterium]|nr:hypothetical protein [Frankiales bacterium]
MRGSSLSGLAGWPVTGPRLCSGCDGPLVGRADKRFCSDACRKRERRRLRVVPTSPDTTTAASTEVADRLLAELEQLGVAGSYEAQVALRVARQLDTGGAIGAAFVSLSKELDRRVAVLRLSAERPDDPTRLIHDRIARKQAHLRAGLSLAKSEDP